MTLSRRCRWRRAIEVPGNVVPDQGDFRPAACADIRLLRAWRPMLTPRWNGRSGAAGSGSCDCLGVGPGVESERGPDPAPGAIFGRLDGRWEKFYSAVTGSMMALTALTLLAGKPPQRACSRTMSSSDAM